MSDQKTEYETKREDLVRRAENAPWSIRKLAQMIGTSRSYLSQVLHAHRVSRPTLEKLESLLDKIDTTDTTNNQ